MKKNKIINLDGTNAHLFFGDCMKLFSKIPDESVALVLTSPPYCMKKAYEDSKADIKSFKLQNGKALKQSIRVLKKGGSLCWQIGYHVKHSSIIPLDYLIYQLVESINKNKPDDEKMILRNRIVWSFGHGLNADKRMSGRHEVILWFTKGDDYYFDLDAIRVPQKYPGKKYPKGHSKEGRYSGNPLGKNPSDVWEIPNVKGRHPEKEDHPCQFPLAIPLRLINALTKEGDIVVDPFMGSGTTGAACEMTGRGFFGADIHEEYLVIAARRINEARSGELRYRPDVPVVEPNQKDAVARKPKTFKW